MIWASQVALVVRSLPACAGDFRDVSSIAGQEDPLEKGLAIHSSILAWRIYLFTSAVTHTTLSCVIVICILVLPPVLECKLLRGRD